MGDLKEKYLQLWGRLTKRQHYMAIGGAVLLVAAIVAASFAFGGKPDMVPLFTNMETKDAGEVAAKLKETKVNYEVQETKQGTTILVPAADVHEARLSLATEGLPRGNKGFEIFDDSKLGVTEFQNKVNYLQALQGELTRTIEQIAAVEKARVHIVLPEDSLYKKNEKPATASIMLKLWPNMELNKKEIKGIVNLASRSIQGLLPENITVVDETGRILNDPDDEEENNVSQQTMTQLDMTRKVQERMQRDVQSMLDQALGEGHSYVRVNVELDFDQRQTDRQTYTPVVDDSGIIRSEQTINESYSGTSTSPGGAAGTQSNVPGYVAQDNNSNASYAKKETTKNYEINEAKEKTVASPGSIKRVNIAVLVNEDITPVQQESIQRSVASAVGINPDRGDTVSVEPLPFSTEAADRRAAEEQAAKDAENMKIMLIVALILLIIGSVAGYFYWKRKQRIEAEQAAIAEAERLAEEERVRAEEERAALLDNGEIELEEMTEEEKEHVSERQTIEELIRNKPAEMAMLVKTWLAED
ncbi:MAG: flagellar M-ring protein FliF [Selenomonadaceae bacterium]|nr:flagellar M-ring protein FliF [Selenomonadaceae bacterium]